MPYSAAAVANEFIELSGGQDLSPMKLQKLVYFAHGWYLALTGRPLIEECVEAWQYGPVIPALYRELKQYGSRDVTEPILQSGGATSWEPRVSKPETAESQDAMKVIREVLDLYGKHSAIKLSNVTHMEGTPWSETYTPGSWSSTIIPNERIESYFKALRK